MILLDPYDPLGFYKILELRLTLFDTTGIFLGALRYHELLRYHGNPTPLFDLKPLQLSSTKALFPY